MKIGAVDGTPEEIHGLLENNGLKLEDYLERPSSPLAVKFIVAPTVLFVVLCLFVWWMSRPPASAGVGAFYILAVAGGIWAIVTVQIRFKNGYGTTVAAIGALLMILLASGTFSLKDSAAFIKDMKPTSEKK
jgi:hypothetical protein